MIKPVLWVFVILLGAFFTRNEIKRKRRLLIATLLLYLFCNNFLVNEALLVYENKGSASLDSSYEAGIVLGGFSKEDPILHRTVFFDANDRLMQAIKLFRQGRIKRIMISSGSAELLNQTYKEADAVRSYLLDIKIPDSCIIIENQSRNTIENIDNSKQLLDSMKITGRVLVISSAWHLPRVKLCLEGRLDADMYATHYLSDCKRDFTLINLLVPSANALNNLELLIKEWFGYVFYLFKV